MMTKAKTNILKFLSVLLLIPIMFAFTACFGNGQLDQKASCNTSGNYNQVATRDDLNDIVGEQTTVNGSGYRMTMEYKGTYGNDFSAQTQINAIIKNDEAAMRYATKYRENGQSGEEKADMYFKDGYVHMELNGRKIKFEASLDAYFNNQEYGEYSSLFDAEQLMATIESNTDVTISRNGNNFKLVFNTLTIAGVDTANLRDIIAFLNFDNEGNLVAMRISFNMTTTVYGATANIEASVVISAFDGEINFPNLSEYESTSLYDL